MSRFLITGGTGFVGRHLVRRLQGLHGADSVHSVGSASDLTQWKATEELFSSLGPVDTILHLADRGGNAVWSAKNCGDQYLCNASMALHVLKAWTLYQPQARLVGFSSLWAYPEALGEMREADYWSGPMTDSIAHYGLCKKILGTGIETQKRQHGRQGTMLVLGTVYGPGDTTDHVIPSLIHRMRQNRERLEVWGDGSQERDFIFVEDQIDGILQHLDSNEALLNIGSGHFYTVREVVGTLARLMNYPGQIVWDSSKPSAGHQRRMNIDLARSRTGWGQVPSRFTSLEDGLKATLAAAA